MNMLKFILLLAAGLAMAAMAKPANPDQARAIEARFPDPSILLHDFPDQPQRTAALVIVRDELFQANGHWPNGKVKAYNDALAQVQAEQTRQGIKLDRGGMTSAQRRIAYWWSGDPDAKPFRRMLFAKYMPGAPDEAAGNDRAQARDEAEIATEARSLGILLATLAIMAALPWLLVRWRHPNVTVPRSLAESTSDPLTLPEDLREVRLPRQQYRVGWIQGVVFEIKTWTETHTKVTASSGPVTIRGGTAHAAGQVSVGPTQVTTETSTTRKDEVWLRTPDGRQLSRTFAGGHFKVASGQLLSYLTVGASPDGRLLLAYNHDARKLDDFDLASQHGLPVLGMWLITALIGTAGGLLAFASQFHVVSVLQVIVARPWTDTAIVVVAVILAGILVLPPKLLYSARRNRAFNRVYRPAYQRLFERATPVLRSGYSVPAGVGGPVVSSGDD